jgi:hypothetical protein
MEHGVGSDTRAYPLEKFPRQKRKRTPFFVQEFVRKIPSLDLSHSNVFRTFYRRYLSHCLDANRFIHTDKLSSLQAVVATSRLLSTRPSSSCGLRQSLLNDLSFSAFPLRSLVLQLSALKLTVPHGSKPSWMLGRLLATANRKLECAMLVVLVRALGTRSIVSLLPSHRSHMRNSLNCLLFLCFYSSRGGGNRSQWSQRHRSPYLHNWTRRLAGTMGR